MNSTFISYYAILVIILSVLTMILVNNRIGGWIIRLLALTAIVMSAMLLTNSYQDQKSLTDYVNQGRAALKERL